FCLGSVKNSNNFHTQPKHE
ncbi:unnamed protein product, partial [Allacma fusca]